MEIQRSKVSKAIRKQGENLDSPNNAFGPSILKLKIGPQALIHPPLPPFSLRRETEAVDVVFQALLSDANEELARLLKDVGQGPLTAPTSASPGRSIHELLMRAVRCAAKQYMLQAELGSFALTDELTKLYNRRGFQALAERQLKLERRSGRGMLLFFIDVDGLKQINDSFGHCEGDLVLKHTASVLGRTLRDSDIIARLGGDEFAVLAIEASGHSEATIRARLRHDLNAINARESRYQISLSVGVARFDHSKPGSLGDLMAQADEAMYLEKRRQTKSEIADGIRCLS